MTPLTRAELDRKAANEATEVLHVWLLDSRRDARAAARDELRRRGEDIPYSRVRSRKP
jgi:hypothetical protein